ncbi:hypothetical protein BB559_007528 [Furculomyces boomerangus]|uniref:Uncharacterized protein n=1 Tax=Furculomyces boomerangus TaxID=61424 RepID=A0A2T9XX01_9FUNG|nr:hypothetical protein BB559_007528 [Furculomyces boomerangus]
MFIKSISIVVLGLTSLTLGQVCSNNGAERCLKANGVDTGYVRCESGVETTYNCASDEFCYGNGLSGIMCIHKDTAKRSNMKRQTSAFRGLENSMNLFINGLHGDAASLSRAITNARTSMFTDTNSLGQFSTSFNNGVKANSARIASGTTSTTNLLKSTTGLNTVFTGSKKFMSAAMANINGLSYMLSDATANAIKSESARDGLAVVIATTMGSSTPKSKRATTSVSLIERQNAFNNLNLAMNIFYPTTFGKALTGNFSPSSLAQNTVQSAQGNNNSTSKLLRSFLGNINGSQKYMTAFSAGSISVANAISTHGSPAIANRIISQYSPRAKSSSATTNFINGAANAVMTIKTRAVGPINTAMGAFQGLMPNACHCADYLTYNNYIFYSALLIIYSLISPTGSCCYPASVPFAIRSLVL